MVARDHSKATEAQEGSDRPAIYEEFTWMSGAERERIGNDIAELLQSSEDILKGTALLLGVLELDDMRRAGDDAPILNRTDEGVITRYLATVNKMAADRLERFHGRRLG